MKELVKKFSSRLAKVLGFLMSPFDSAKDHCRYEIIKINIEINKGVYNKGKGVVKEESSEGREPYYYCVEG